MHETVQSTSQTSELRLCKRESSSFVLNLLLFLHWVVLCPGEADEVSQGLSNPVVLAEEDAEAQRGRFGSRLRGTCLSSRAPAFPSRH